MLALTVRLICSLAVVIGLLLLITKFSAKRMRGPANSLVKVVERRSLSRSSAISVVTVGGRVLVIGTTENEMRLLTELDPADLETPPTEDDFDALLASYDLAAEDHASRAPLFKAPDFDAALDAPDSTAPVLLSTPAAEAPEPKKPVGESTKPAGKAKKPALVSTSDSSSALAGSVLSPQTWKQAFAAATGRVREDA